MKVRLILSALVVLVVIAFIACNYAHSAPLEYIDITPKPRLDKQSTSNNSIIENLSWILSRESPHLQKRLNRDRLLITLPIIIIIGFLFRRNRGITKVLGAAFEAIKSTPRRRFLWWIFLLSLLEYLLAAHLVFHRLPHTPDEVVYYIQGSMFAGGLLKIPAPQPWDAFKVMHLVNLDGMVFSRFHPGHPMLLAVGFLVGLPWLIVPLCSALDSVLVVKIAYLLYGDEIIPRLAGILCLLSPYVVIHSSSYLSHAPTAFFLLAFVYSSLRAIESLRVRYALAAGITLGLAFTSRPLTAVGISLPIVVYFLVQAVVRLRWAFIKNGFLIALPVILFVMLYGFYNYQLTGDPYKLAFNVDFPQDKLGFDSQPRHFGAFSPQGGQVGFKGHSPARAICNLLVNLVGLSMQLFGFPFISLALVPFGLFLPGRIKQGLYLLSFFLGLVIAYSLYWDHSAMSFFGARYYYSGFFVLIILSAAGMVNLSRLFSKRADLVAIIVVLLFFESMFTYDLLYLTAHRIRSRFHAQVSIIARNLPPGKKLIFCDHYESAASYLNAPTFDGEVLYSKNRGKAENIQTTSLYPDRSSYLITVVDSESEHANRLGTILIRRYIPSIEPYQGKVIKYKVLVPDKIGVFAPLGL